jgi:peptidoglycan/xylan/chitin deacetylase (PgdA/CDA1 family)/SAM-dependent methyltransferase
LAARRKLQARCGPAAAVLEPALRRTAVRAGVALIYHRIGRPGGDLDRELNPNLDSGLFERQVEYLASHFDLVPASRLAAASRRRARGDPFPVAITFDDDLTSHAAEAAPVLERAGAPATFFLCGASLGEPAAFWWDSLQRLVDQGAELPPPLRGGSPIRELGTVIERLDVEERDRLAARLGELAGPDPGHATMGATDVERLAAGGFEIGFHTRRHHPLTRLDADQVASALHDGRDRLETLAGRRIDTLAYPHGAADAEVATGARAAGFASGFTTTPAAVTPAVDPLLLGRVEASFDSVGGLAWSIATALAGALASGGESGARVTDARRAVMGGRAGRAARRAAARPRVGGLDLGDLRTTKPVSPGFGFERGLPVDRHYVERFLERHAAAVRGRVLEIGDDGYTRRFGGDAVDSIDVLHADEGNPQATIVADLTDAPEIADATYDCVICTQTLLLIYDVRAAVATIRRILRPGGTALVTVPGLSRVCRAEAGEWGDFWRFTSMSARRLFEEFRSVDVETFGNVLAGTAQLHGIASDELDQAELDAHDPDFEVVIGVRATA